MPTYSQADAENVVQLVADGKTRAAVQHLMDSFKADGDARYEDAVLLKNRLQTLEQKVGIGVVSQADENLERARINKGILDLAKQAAGQEGNFSKNKRLKIFIPVAAILLIGAVLSFQFFKGGDVENLPPSTLLHGQCFLDDAPLANAILEISYGEGTVLDTTDSRGFYKVEVPQTEGHSIQIAIRPDGQPAVKRSYNLSSKKLDIRL